MKKAKQSKLTNVQYELGIKEGERRSIKKIIKRLEQWKVLKGDALLMTIEIVRGDWDGEGCHLEGLK